MNIAQNLRRTRPRLIIAATVLAIAALLIPASQIASARTTSAATFGPKPTIVLEHGAWADSSSWTGVIRRLQRDGYTVDAPPNPLRGLSYDSATLADYLEEVDHVAARIVKLEKALDEAVQQAPSEIRAVIEALQALRGVAQTTAASIVSELGSLSRFPSPRPLMGYSGLVAREHSSGNRIQRAGSPRPAAATSDGCWWKPPGRISTGRT